MLHECACMQMWKLVPLKLFVVNPPRRKVCCRRVYVGMLVCVRERNINSSRVIHMYMCADVEAGTSQASETAYGRKSYKKKGLLS